MSLKKGITIFLIVLMGLNSLIFAQDSTGDTGSGENGWTYYAKRQYRKSIEYLLKEKEQFPNRPNIYVILGWDYKELKQYAEMEKYSLEGLKVKSTDIRIIKNLGEAYFFQGKYRQAIEIFERYLKYKYDRNDPYISTLYYYLGYSFYMLELYNKAEIALMASNFYKPNFAFSNLYLAMVYEKMENNKKANFYYNQTLKIVPANEEAKKGANRTKAL